MKKIVYFFASLLALSSCSKDEVLQDSENGNIEGTNILYADLIKSRLTIDPNKAIDDTYPIKWTEGDKFTAFEGDKANEYSLINGAGSTSGTFQGAGNPTCAIFPSSAKAKSASGVITFSLPTNYTETDNSLNVPMYGTIDGGNVDFNVKLTAIMKVQYKGLPEGYNTLKVTSDNQPLSGTFKYNPTTKKLENGTTKKYVTIQHANNTDAFYVPLKPGLYNNGLSFSVINETTKHEIQLITLVDKKFEAGTLYDITRDYKTTVAKFDAKQYLKTVAKNIHVDGMNKWFAINHGDDGFGSCTADTEGLKMVGTSSQGKLPGTSNYLSCTGGYCFPEPAKSGVYMITFTVKSQVAKGTNNASRMGITIGAEKCPVSLTLPENTKSGFYGYAYKAEWLKNLTEGATQKVQGTFDCPNANEWCTHSVYVDFNKWAENNNKGTQMRVIKDSDLTSFDVRVWPQTENTIWLKELQVSEVVM